MLLSVIFSTCTNTDQKHNEKLSPFSSYRDIPGITREEIAAIENVLAQTDYFIYGMLPSTETFLGADGEIGGFTALVCKWLTELFGIPFVPRLYLFQDLIAALGNGEIDFNGGLTPNEARRLIYFMTDPIAHRSLKYFRITGSTSIPEIRQTRLPRYILQENSSIAVDVLYFAGGTFEPVYIRENEEAYELLKSGYADAFISEGVIEYIFDIYGDVEVTDFFPLIYSPVSFSTLNPQLTPFISVVQKALDNNAVNYLNELYDQGYKDYLKYKLFLRLTDEEKKYIIENPVIPFGAEYDNYQISFYNTRQKEWQGISFDVLKQVEMLTGLRFSVANDEHTEFHELLQMLETGEIFILSELTHTPHLARNFIWPNNAFITEQSVLISKIDYPNININRIHSVKVGLIINTAHTEFFNEWFPNHPGVTYYQTQEAGFEALMNGDVDMVMSSYSTLLYLINYLELADYKANIIFNNNFGSTFGINREHVILRSIIDKALELINTTIISEQWKHRTFDYRLKVAEARLPWLIGSIALSLCVLALIAFLFKESLRTGKRLEDFVDKRTKELGFQTATLTTLFDSIPDLIFTKNKKFTFLHCNKAFLEHFNKDQDDIVGKDDIEGLGLPAERAEEYREWDKKVLFEGQTTINEEYSPRFDGTELLLETKKTPLMLEGKVVGLLGIARDITKRKEMEGIIKSSYDYAKKLSDALASVTKSSTIPTGDLKAVADILAHEGCLALNTHRVSIWNITENAQTLKNISCFNRLLGKHVVENDLDLLQHKEYARLLKSERLVVTTNIKSSGLFASDYNPKLCALLDAPIRVDGKLIGVVCAAQDYSEEYPEKREWEIKEQNFVSSLADLMALAITGSELKNARDEAENASQIKSSFLANMSHEIRTPMNAILGITEILIQNEKLLPETEEGLNKIYSSCDLLLGIINDILDFSKIEAGKLDIIPARYKVASMINDSAHLNLMRLESKPIDFELQIDENVPAKLIGDELRIKQILNNLLSNAFKYTDSGKVTLSVNSKPTQDNVTLILSVHDTGHGMTKEQLDMLFEEYSRFNLRKNITVEGSGLGLAITQRLVNLMGGEIFVESELGKGTLFTIKLPQRIVDSEVLGSEVALNLRQFRQNYMAYRKRIQFARDPMPYGNVLIVDDVETNLYVAVGLMKLYKLQIDTAMNGQSAINKIKEGNVYDIVFMDHMMPEMDGIEAANHLRNLGYSAPIVALTANAVTGQADMFFQNGFDDFISKPIDIRQLNSILNKFVRDKQPNDVIEEARRQMGIETNENNGNLSKKDLILIGSFIRDANKAIAVIDQLCQKTEFEKNKEDLREFTIVVHGLKSSLALVGENELSETASKLEEAGREQNTAFIAESKHEFLDNLQKLLEKLNSEQNEESIDKPDEDIEDLRSKLLSIQAMCKNYNKKGVLNVLSGINDCSKETKTVLEKITGYLLHSEFEEAEKTAAEYAIKLSK